MRKDIAKFEIELGKTPEDTTKIIIDGNDLANITRRVDILGNVHDVPTVKLELLAMGECKVTGEGKISINNTVVSDDIARQIYDQLKKYFTVKDEKFDELNHQTRAANLKRRVTHSE